MTHKPQREQELHDKSLQCSCAAYKAYYRELYTMRQLRKCGNFFYFFIRLNSSATRIRFEQLRWEREREGEVSERELISFMTDTFNWFLFCSLHFDSLTTERQSTMPDSDYTHIS